VNVLPALLGKPEKPVRDHLVLAPNRKANLALREGPWLYIGAPGGGGFGGTKPGDHALGGGGALKFTGETNSDFAIGKLKPGAPKAQLYHLVQDPRQTTNVIEAHPDIAKRMAEHLAAILH
jgi:hypothetical protein